MKIKETSLYAIGTCIALVVALVAIWPPANVRDVEPVIPQPLVSGTELPAMMHSFDTTCGSGRQCSDAEFDDLVGDLQKQWSITPEWVRSACAASSTIPSMERCIFRETSSWLDKNSFRQAPWLDPQNLGSLAAYAKK
jgi:hypothetical protein